MEKKYIIDSVVPKGDESGTIGARLAIGSGLLRLCDDSVDADDLLEHVPESEALHIGRTPNAAMGDIAEATLVAQERAYFRKKIAEGKIPESQITAARILAYGLNMDIESKGVFSEGLPLNVLQKGGLTPRGRVYK